MKIKHEYDDGPDYLTKGKVYEAGVLGRCIDGDTMVEITADDGVVMWAFVMSSSHLDDRPFTVVEP